MEEKNLKNLAVFASGRGTNFSAILRAIKKGKIKANLSLLICDNYQAGVIKRAKRADVKTVLVLRENFKSNKEFEEEIIKHLEEHKIDVIVLAGFMRLLSSDFVKRYYGKILNIHPALLPSFKGTYAIKDAFDYGVKVTGVTVHFVDEKMDHGPIILQEPVRIKEDDTLETLEKKIHRIEHQIYPEAIKLFIEGSLMIRERKVEIIPPAKASY